MMFQKTSDEKADVKDHVWMRRGPNLWQCATCGAVTPSPPSYPTRPNWMPDRYEPLTQDQRDLV